MKTATVLLAERLKELDTQPSGLPARVVDQLRAVAQAEVEAVQKELADDLAALERQAEERLRKHIARAITDATIAKAFKTRATAGTRTTADSTPPPATGAQGGAS